MTGVRGSSTGAFKIIVDEEEPVTVNKIKGDSVAQNNKGVLFYNYKSELKYHRVKIVRTEYEVSLVSLLCTVDIPPNSPTEQPPSSNIIEEKDLDDDGRIDKVAHNYQPVYIEVKVSTFRGVEYNYDGGAIHAINTGIKCDQNVFEDCKSKQGAGGAIYINYDFDFQNNIELTKLQFLRCEATYGGAICIISKTKQKSLVVSGSTFTSNKATNNDVDSADFGGSAIYMNIFSGSIMKCKFIDNIGGEGSVKIVNYFNKPSQAFITDPKSCIYYLCGNNGVPFELNKCSFNGKFKPNSKIINGKSISENGEKLIVRNCIFPSQYRDILNSNSMKKFMVVDFDNVEFERELPNNSISCSWKLVSIISVAAVLVIVSVVALILFIRKRKNRNEVDGNGIEMSSETRDLSINNNTINDSLIN